MNLLPPPLCKVGVAARHCPDTFTTTLEVERTSISLNLI